MAMSTDINPTTRDAPRNISLQALRGVAACSVMVYHAAHFTGLRTGTTWLEPIFNGLFGFYGVLVFFVLSGYLMEAAIRRYDAKTFALHRFVRLYPTYWLVCGCFFLVQSARGGAWESIPWTALNLLPLGEMTRSLGIEWTLLYEVFFYMVCTLLCLWRRAHLPLLVCWLAIVAIAVFRHGQYGTTMQPTFAEVPFSAWNIGFICGGFAGQLNRHVKNLDPAGLFLGGFALILLAQLTRPVVDLFLIAPGMACLVLALVRSEQAQQRTPGLVMRSLSLLGECSYGLYLAHSLGIQIVLQYLPPAAPAGAAFVAMLGVGLTIGLIAGGMDVLLYRSLKARIDRRVRARTPSEAVVAQPEDADKRLAYHVPGV
jgi:peptidoglycan/LPS O-acetylase OafA/YrhL